MSINVLDSGNVSVLGPNMQSSHACCISAPFDKTKPPLSSHSGLVPVVAPPVPQHVCWANPEGMVGLRGGGLEVRLGGG